MGVDDIFSKDDAVHKEDMCQGTNQVEDLDDFFASLQ